MCLDDHVIQLSGQGNRSLSRYFKEKSLRSRKRFPVPLSLCSYLSVINPRLGIAAYLIQTADPADILCFGILFRPEFAEAGSVYFYLVGNPGFFDGHGFLEDFLMLAFPCLGVPCIFRLSRIRTTGQVSIGIAGQIRYGFSSGQNPCLRCGGQIFVLLIPVVQVPGRLPEPDIHFIQHAGFDLLPLSKGHFHERHADAVVELFRTVHLSCILFAGKAEFHKGIFHFVQVCICIEGKDDLIKLSRLQVDPLQAVRLLLFFRLVKIFFISSKGFSTTFQHLFVCRYRFAFGHFFILRCLYRHIGKISVLVFDIPPAKPQFTICNRLVRIILQIQGKLRLVSRHHLIIICNNVNIHIL